MGSTCRFDRFRVTGCTGQVEGSIVITSTTLPMSRDRQLLGALCAVIRGVGDGAGEGADRLELPVLHDEVLHVEGAGHSIVMMKPSDDG